VSPDGQVEWCRIQAVHRAEVPWETIVAIDTTDGTLTTTAGHRVFTSPTTKVEAKDLVIGDAVLTSDADGRASTAFVIDTRIVTSRHFMYDLTAERWHNFTLHGCNVVVSNSPDRNYKFRPPQGEGTVGCYNRVFGYIWEDEELAEYLEIALWKWNAHPPETEELCNIDTLCQRKPAWKAALLWGALVNAAQALAYNWVSEEFSVAGDTMVVVVLPDGHEVELSIAELHDICCTAVSPHLASNDAIRVSFQAGTLCVQAVNPNTGNVGLYKVADVVQHRTGDRASVTCMTADGRSVTTTCDHSLFHPLGGDAGLKPVRAEDLCSGDLVAEVQDGALRGVTVDVTVGLPLEVSYDLCVPGPENFVLANGIVAHNSYSIGGISLDLDRSSKYMDLKRNAEEQWDKLTEAKSRTTKYIRGLQQPRFGIGIRSAFGPATGRGVLSPRNFI
jgi:hypothetical protein